MLLYISYRRSTWFKLYILHKHATHAHTLTCTHTLTHTHTHTHMTELTSFVTKLETTTQLKTHCEYNSCRAAI